MRAILSWAFLVALLLTSLLSTRCSRIPEEPIDLDAFRASGDDWTVRQDTLPDGGIVRLHHDKWLMYFVHWRPLTQEKEDLSPEYVRNLMLNFWGENMPFTLEDAVGQMEVAGHKAYFVDGSIYEGTIQSRFVVWNCPETERQFIADCNINLRRGTPPELFDLQNDITLSISCHGTASVQKHPLLTQAYESRMYGISFLIPENWRTSEYQDTDWFPDGLSRTNGTLWTLLTDSEKCVELRWDNQETEMSPLTFSQYVKRVESDSVVGQAVSRLEDIKVKGLVGRKRCMVGHGSFQYSVSAGGREVRKPFIFKAFLWNRGDRTYFLLASMASLDEVWGLSVDLAPSDEVLDRFVEDEIIANMRVFDRDCLK
jgi:hypothetical protein